MLEAYVTTLIDNPSYISPCESRQLANDWIFGDYGYPTITLSLTTFFHNENGRNK